MRRVRSRARRQVGIMVADLAAAAVAERLAHRLLYPAACRDATDPLLP